MVQHVTIVFSKYNIINIILNETYIANAHKRFHACSTYAMVTISEIEILFAIDQRKQCAKQPK